MEVKVSEGWQLEARLEKLVVPGHEVLRQSARWLDLLHSEETLKGACESPRVTWLQGSAAGRAVSSSGKNPAGFLHFSLSSLVAHAQLHVL